MSDQNCPVFGFESDRPPSAGRDRAKRIAFRGARFVALAALALCATTGAAALLSFWLFASDRPLLRELYYHTYHNVSSVYYSLQVNSLS